MHLPASLPTSVESGFTRGVHWDVEIVTTDSGAEVRNNRWSQPLRSWQIAFNNAQLTSAAHHAVERMFFDTEGGTHTFNFTDERTGEVVKVRFDTDLQYTHTAGSYYHLDSFTLREVR